MQNSLYVLQYIYLLHPFCTDFVKQANSLFQELDLSGRGKLQALCF